MFPLLFLISTEVHFSQQRIANISFQQSPNTAKSQFPRKLQIRLPAYTNQRRLERKWSTFYKTLINLFLRGKSRLWYAKSRYSSLTFLQLMKKNSPDPKGLLGWTHQLEPTSRDCIRDLEIPPNRRINSIWIEFTSIAEKNVFQFIMEYWKNLHVDMKCVWCMLAIELVRRRWRSTIYHGNGYWTRSKTDQKQQRGLVH